MTSGVLVNKFSNIAHRRQASVHHEAKQVRPLAALACTYYIYRAENNRRPSANFRTNNEYVGSTTYAVGPVSTRVFQAGSRFPAPVFIPNLTTEMEVT